MAKEPEPVKLSSPHIFLVRMLVFVILVGIIGGFLQKQIVVAFMANPGLNALIIVVEVLGIALSVRQVLRLYPEIAWVNNFRLRDPRRQTAAGLARPDGSHFAQSRRPDGVVRPVDARHS